MYTSIKLRQGRSVIRSREKLILNYVEEGFNEERINTIPGESLDYVEEIYNRKKDLSFKEVITNKKVLMAINELTVRQQEILRMCFILSKNEKEIAQVLNISAQSVNKTKNVALRKLREQLGGD